MIETHKGVTQHEHSLDHALEFFGKAGSVFDTPSLRDFYSGNESCLSLFQKTWIVDEELSMKLLFWLRNCRGGAGNRSGFRSSLRWLCEVAPQWVQENIHLIPLYGRFDDLRECFGTAAEGAAVNLWIQALTNKETYILAAKWADISDKPLRRQLGLNEAGFRKYLAALRSPHIVESKMCAREWGEIVYKTVPSVAMARYTKAFKRHDEERFEAFKEGLKRGTEKVNAAVLFPHDCVRTCLSGDLQIAEAQFDALPNYLEGTDQRIMVLCDTSGSMSSGIGGSVQAIHVSQGLALYCSAKIPAGNPFHKKFIGFCSESRFVNWGGMGFAQAVRSRKVFDGAIGSTRVDLALDFILDSARNWNLHPDQIPNVLLIVSDMQFTGGVLGGGISVKTCLARFQQYGYEAPKVVYWNLAGYAGSPDTKYGNNMALVSGFSPSILKAVLGGEDFTPIGVMMRAVRDYEVVVPGREE